jgi:hypothetical protein
MPNAVLKFMMVILSISLAPSPVMAIGISTIICDNNTANWVGFRKKSTLLFSPVYEMRPKKNLWIELTEGDYCESMQTGSDSFSPILTAPWSPHWLILINLFILK